MKKFRLLYIDYLSEPGHEVFNKGLIARIERNGCIEASYVWRKDYLSDIKGINHVIELPHEFFIYRSSIGRHLGFIRCMHLVLRLLDFRDYDAVLFASYDNLTMALIRSQGNEFLVNHNNLCRLDSRLRRALLRMAVKNRHSLVFETHFGEFLKEIGACNVEVVDHGLPLVWTQKSGALWSIEEQNKKNYLDSFERIYFCPKYNRQLSENDLKNIDSLVEVLQRQNAVMVIKEGDIRLDSFDNIVVYNSYMDETFFYYVFNKASAVILFLDKTYRFRLSSLFYYAMSINCPVLIDHDDYGFDFSMYIDYEYRFKGFKNLADSLLSNEPVPISRVFLKSKKISIVEVLLKKII